MGWYKVTMLPAEIVNRKAIRLQEAFADVFVKLGGPEDAGMFGSLDVMRNEYFFSPGAVRIFEPAIVAYGGIQCEAPKRSEVAMLVVNHDARAVSFAVEA
jgi:hypothetical protein